MSAKELPQFFDHAAAENRWYKSWEDAGLFKPTAKDGVKNYCIVIPPPNVTGILHEGHALNNTLQDVLIRYHRMLGENVLWQPGTDHAGISTQYMVEKDLAKEGLTKEQLGREEFLKRVWKWKEQKGGHIISQLKRLGASCDWSRERFTMDEGLSRAVRETFVRLYEEGLIYRGEYMVNWCPRCDTALSNLEVVLPEECEAEKGQLWYIKYPLVDGSGHLTVATTRPETMLGDTAVAVNPEDPRYAGVPGKLLQLPLTDRRIPVIGDAYVDMQFGTGALKITPGHDFNDNEIGKKHCLAAPQAIDKRGRMTAIAGKYAGLDRFEARAAMVADLEAQGLLEKTEPYLLRAGRCYRCKTVVEPTISEQWFVKIQPLAEPALAAVKDGRAFIIPEAQEKEYYTWMENLRDWCISRQIWWGHQIPAWHCAKCGQITVTRQDPTACGHCGSDQITRDPDVLDTWFSSALWPFSTLGWPDKTPEVARFYPNTAMITAYDILKFWVARMMMMGIHLMGGQVPFTDIYLHGLVRDELGRKKSKTLGNFIDPIELIDEYGADALRFALAIETYIGRDVRLGEPRIQEAKKFINKIWNAARFTLASVPEAGVTPEYSPADRWIASRLQAAIASARDHVEHYRFHEMADSIYHFVWDELCDWYIEWAKPALYSPDSPGRKAAAQQTLRETLDAAIRLLHPIMPFFTEELFQTMGDGRPSVMVSAYPAVDPAKQDAALEARLLQVQEVVAAIRAIRSDNLVPAGTKTKVTLIPDTAEVAVALADLKLYILSPPQVQIAELTIAAPGTAADKKAAIRRAGAVEVALDLAGVINPDEEIARIDKEMKKVEGELQRVVGKLNNEAFMSKAPAEIKEKQERIKAECEAGIATLKATRAKMEAMKGK